jgi:peroxiredoxin
MRADIVPGARFPDYELPDHTGRKRKLSELQGDAPMIVFLSRGFYCPKDRRQAMNLVAFEPELKVGYAKLVTISTDDLLATNENRDGLGAQVLRDEHSISALHSPASSKRPRLRARRRAE